jgi:hypothetical protein
MLDFYGQVERRNVVMYTHPVAAFFHCAAKVSLMSAHIAFALFHVRVEK